MDRERNMPGLQPNLPQHHPANPPPTVMSLQSNLSAAAAAGSPRASGAYHPSPSVGRLHAGANCTSPSTTAARSPNFHGFAPALQPAMVNVTNAGTNAVAGGGIPPHVNPAAPGITQAMGHPVYFGAPPRGSIAFAQPSVSQRTPPNMLPPAPASFGGRRGAPYRSYPPLIPRPAATDPLGNSIGDVAPPRQSMPEAVSSHIAAGGFRGYSGGGGPFVQERMQERVQEPRIMQHQNELLSRPLTTRPSPEALMRKSVAKPPTEVGAGAPAEAAAGPVAGSSFAPLGAEGREMANEIAYSGEPSSKAVMKDKSAKLIEGKNQEPPQPTARKRSICTLLPPGYLNRCRGTVTKRTTSGSGSGTSTREQSPVVKGPKGALHAALNSDRKREPTDVLERWMLTEDQILGDIRRMRENLPRGVVINSSSRSTSDKESEKKKKKDEDALLDPRLTPSEKEWLKIAREEDREDKDGADKNKRDGAEGQTSKATGAIDPAGAMSSGKPENGSSSEASAPVVGKYSESKGADAGAVSEADKDRAAAGVADKESGKAEGALKAMEDEDKEKEPALAVPTHRELMEWDAKRDALELKELMILERTRERRRSLAKERAKADEVIQFLSQLGREDRGRSELLRMKRWFLLDLAKMLQERVSESDELLQKIRTLKGIKPSEADRGSSVGTPPSPSPSPSESTIAINSPPTSKPSNKGKGKEKARGASAGEAMDVDEDVDVFETDRANSADTKAFGGREGQGQAGGGRGEKPGEGGVAVSASSEVLVGDEDPADVHSVTAHAMVKCWDALGERLAASRKVVREVGVDTEEDVGGTGAGPVGRNGGKGKSRRADVTDADGLGEGGQSSHSSADESDVSGTVRVHGARSRKRKLTRTVGATSVSAGSSIRKRGRRRQGAGAGSAIREGVERERLDWPSTVIPRTPYNVPLLLSCLSTYPDKVVAALHPAPGPRSPPKDGKQGGETQVCKFAVDLLPGFTREEKLRQAHLHDRAVFEQVESVIQMYAEVGKMLEQPRANSPKLKGAFKSERHEVEREMWRRELEDLQEAMAKAVPPPSPEGCKDAAKAKSKLKGRRGATGATRVQSKDSLPATTPSGSPGKGVPASSTSTETTSVASSTNATSSATCSPRSLTRAAKPAISGTSVNSNSAPTSAKGGKDVASTAEPIGARKGRPARGAAKTPNPAVGRRTSTRGSEAKARA